ncbi:LPS export ABC transporter periplasmic protein LptC [Agitococcus lubricus]|uniref:LPS export ABC transporter protein LptC n=1 Tax=Agitococcus lubricus TaxID=1077255 RepID=A0A2T5IZN5_9GAMM|nr:LPS export ABC transporter periplasmic protein LptC [Agitococcus lubricus]PTQ89426.1 LPS export ABC transporter protein LptC [Agitococcus lubricus]
MDIRNSLSLAGGLLVLATVGYYWGGLGQKTIRLNTSDPQNLPEYEVQTLEGLQTNASGQIERTLRAQALTHYRQPEQSILQTPDVTLYQAGQAAWHITAQLATAHESEQTIHLSGKVTGQRLNSTALSLKTEFLSANQRTQTLSTDRAVEIRSAYAQLNSQGLDANIEQGVLTFPAHVRGTYVVPPR